jgi:hypothetical protein
MIELSSYKGIRAGAPNQAHCVSPPKGEAAILYQHKWKITIPEKIMRHNADYNNKKKCQLIFLKIIIKIYIKIN